MTTNDTCETTTPNDVCCREAAATVLLRVTGMTCTSCETHVGEALASVPGVSDVAVSHASATARLTWTSPMAGTQALIDAVREAGYDASVDGEDENAAPVAPVAAAAAQCSCCRGDA